jgi:hypothetical protein
MRPIISSDVVFERGARVLSLIVGSPYNSQRSSTDNSHITPQKPSFLTAAATAAVTAAAVSAVAAAAADFSLRR